jgi:hypothetical protein
VATSHGSLVARMRTMIDAVRDRRRIRHMRRSVAHLDKRLLCDTGLEDFAVRKPAKPFWWLWQGDD